MANIKVNVSVKDLDKVETMISLLNKYKDSLPDDLLNSLKELADSDSLEIDSDFLALAGCKSSEAKCIADGVVVVGVRSVNPVLKRLTVYPFRYDGLDKFKDDNGVVVKSHKYPKSFTLKCGDDTIVEWDNG